MAETIARPDQRAPAEAPQKPAFGPHGAFAFPPVDLAETWQATPSNGEVMAQSPRLKYMSSMENSLAVGLAENLKVDTISFNDGSRYCGTLKNAIPDGIGTCLWHDGNKYDGEWRNGVMHGFGTYLWTSGQRYDGEWRDGKREGIGVKRYVDGSSFDGFWRDGRKHGVGVYRPAAKKPSSLVTSGSFPSRRDQPLASPTTQPGVLSSTVSLPLSAVGGLVATAMEMQTTHSSHPDISPKHWPGVVALKGGPSGSTSTVSTPAAPGVPAEDGSAAVAAAVAAAALSPAATVPSAAAAVALPVAAAAAPSAASLWAVLPGSSLPSGLAPADSVIVPRRSTPGGHNHPAADAQSEMPELMNDDRDMVLIRAFENGRLLREDTLSAGEIKRIFGPLWAPRESKVRSRVKEALRIGRKLKEKHGELLFKGMPGFNLMAQLQLGVRYSVGLMSNSVAAKALAAAVSGPPKFSPSDFKEKRKVYFPAAGTNLTPAHASADFKWKDYAPSVFRSLRALYGVNDAEYMLALGGSQALYALHSPGKSGCLFFLSDDERFLIKTMRKSEIKTLVAMLPALHKHARSCPQSLVARFYGVHGVKRVHGRIVRFVVMQNLFNSDVRIHRKFDLKGSTFERTSGHPDPNDAKTTYKDLDLDFLLRLPADAFDALATQLKQDAAFLQAVGVMDYSLLLGIHYCARGKEAAAAAAAAAGGDAHSMSDLQSPGMLRRPSPQGNAPAWYAAGSDLGHSGRAESESDVFHTAGDRSDIPPPAPPPATPRDGPGVAAGFPPPTPSVSASLPGSPRGSIRGPSASAAAGGQNGAASNGAAGAETGGMTPPFREHGLDGRREARESTTGDGPGASALPGFGLDVPSLAAEKLRNFDVFTSNQEDTRKKLHAVEQRMREVGYGEQRIADVLGLMKLKVLGDRFQRASLKKRGKSPALVLQALNQIKLTTAAGDGDSDGGSVDDGEGGVGGQREGDGVLGTHREVEHQQLGFNMHAVAIPKTRLPGGGEPAGEEVIITFAIIDILQEYNVRKLFERGFKSLVHDSEAISVAPPDKYAQRFVKFMLNETFLDPAKHKHVPHDVARQRISEEPDSEAAAVAKAKRRQQR